jgi:catechol 2,3-dioxygenase-like lactoylglutathione lyase family enzyme
MTMRSWCVAVAAALVIGAVAGRITSRAQEPVALPAERVTGIGGVFFKAKDPKSLTRWYREHLGVDVVTRAGGTGTEPATFAWRERQDPSRIATTTWAIFPETTTYVSPGTASFMVNYRVRSLDRMLAQLRAQGVTAEPRITEHAAGRFAWIVDPEGNRIELWEPKPAL